MTLPDIEARLATCTAGQALDLNTIDACGPLCAVLFGAGTAGPAWLHVASPPDKSPDGGALRITGTAALPDIAEVDLSLVFAEAADGVSTHISVSMPAGEAIPIPGLSSLSVCNLALFLDISAGGFVTGRLTGSMPFGDGPAMQMPLCVELPISSSAWAFYGGVEAAPLRGDGDLEPAAPAQIPLTMRDLCARLALPALASALPDGLDDIGLTSFSFVADGAKLSSLSLGIATTPAWAWQLEPGIRLDGLWATTGVTDPTGAADFLVSLGGRLSLGGGRLELLADGTRTWGAVPGGWMLRAIAISPVEIATGMSIEDVALALSHEKGTWDIAGSVDIRLLDHEQPIHLSIDTTVAREAGAIHLQADHLDLQILTLSTWNGAFIIDDVSLTIRGEQVASGDGRKSTPGFDLQAHARLTWSGGELRGALTLSTDAEHPQLAFKIDGQATIALPGPSGLRHPQVVLSEVHAGISRDGSSGWRFDGGATVRLTNLAPRIQSALPATDMACDLTITTSSLSLHVDKPPLALKIPLPATQGRPPRPLGTVDVRIESLGLDVGESGVAFDMAVGVVLPGELNSVFGHHEVFVTGKELGVKFSAGIIKKQPGFSIELLDIPFAIFEKGADDRVHWDLGGAGEIDFTIPEIVCTAGAFTVTVSVHENERRPLRLPLVLIKHALALKLPAALVGEVPDYLPIRSPSLFDETTTSGAGKLKAADFSQRFHLTGEAAVAAEQLAKAMDRLPGRFKEYLRGQGPTGFDIDVSITPAGSVSLDLSFDDQPIKVLFPAGSEIIGLELKSISFGEVLGGALFELRLDASIDTFDILALAVCVSGAAGSVPALDYLSTMRDTLVAEKLLMFIVYETVVPIPIPLFCNQLGVDYKGLLGIEAKTSWSFPEPALDIATAFAEVSGLWDFVSDPAAHFPTALPLPFTVGESYLALPPYLGKDHYVGVKGANVYEGNAATLVAHVADAIKFFSLYDALRAIPIDKRIGAITVTLGPLTVDGDWIVCTAREFHDNLTSKTAGVPAGLVPLMALTPDDKRGFLAAPGTDSAADPTDERRVVILLAGGVAMAHVAGLRASFALVGGGRHGFFTSVRITGELTNAIAVDLHGSVQSEARDAQGNDSFVIQALGQILVAKHPLLDIRGEARSADGTLKFQGGLQVLPDLPELHFSSSGHASFSADAFEVGGTVDVTAMGLHGNSTFRLDTTSFQCTEDVEGALFGLWSGSLRLSGASLADRRHVQVTGSVKAESLRDWIPAVANDVSKAVIDRLDALRRGLDNAIAGYSNEGWLKWTVGGGAIDEAALEALRAYVMALKTGIEGGRAVGGFAATVVSEITARLGPFGAVVPYLIGGPLVVTLTRATFTASLDDGLAGRVTLTVTGTIPGATVGPWTFTTDLRNPAAIAQGLVSECFGGVAGIAVV